MVWQNVDRVVEASDKLQKLCAAPSAASWDTAIQGDLLEPHEELRLSIFLHKVSDIVTNMSVSCKRAESREWVLDDDAQRLHTSWELSSPNCC